MHIIPFDRRFEEAEQDHTLKTEFQRPKNQSAILNWLIEGYRLLVTEGLTQPAIVSAATDSYQHDSDKVAQFIEDMLTPEPSAEERTADVYAAYTK
jgi:putative DNA primase/helicase